MQIIRSALQFLALDEASQERYLQPVPAAPLEISCPQVEILTSKPLLIMALIVGSKPYCEDWVQGLTTEQRTALAELEAVITMMVEIGFWPLFSPRAEEREDTYEYRGAWGACRTLAANCLQKLNWPTGLPELPFEYFLSEFTEPVTNWSEDMVR